MTPLPVSLLPDTGRRRRATVACTIGGCDLLELAAEFGTPLFVYDEAHLRARCREAVAAFGDGVAYATKAFLCTAMARLAHEEGMRLDVATGGELHVALAAGRAGRRGWCCTATTSPTAELRAALAERRRAHRRRLASTSSTASSAWSPPTAAPSRRCWCASRRASRPTPTSSCRPARTTRSSASAWPPVRPPRRSSGPATSPAVELVGVHVHIGSQVFVADFFAQAVDVVAPVRDVARTCPSCRSAVALGVAYVEGEEAPTIAEWGDAVHAAVRRGGHHRPRHAPSRGGRSWPRRRSRSTRSGTIKELPGIRTYVAVDGGMSDNPRPVLYGSGYEAFLPRAAAADRPVVATVVGKHCESGDVLVREARRAGRPRRRRHRSPRRSPAPTATRWAPTTTRCPGPPWSSWPTATPAWWCGARPTTTCSASTSSAPQRPTRPESGAGAGAAAHYRGPP